jgi:methionyl-tRNA formyltransferase
VSQIVLFGAQRALMLPAFEQIARMTPALLIRRPEELDAALLEQHRPRHVILPDWSWKIDPALLARASFVGFHAAALPDYRGGSPLQHQILDGLNETRLTMFRMVPELDAGPILLDAPLSLEGTIGQIWQRIATMIPAMVAELLSGRCQERPQSGGGFARRRRQPHESQLTDLQLPLDKLYDVLRALDDPYPNAFLTIDDKQIAFRKPRLEGEILIAEAVITERRS